MKLSKLILAVGAFLGLAVLQSKALFIGEGHTAHDSSLADEFQFVTDTITDYNVANEPDLAFPATSNLTGNQINAGDTKDFDFNFPVSCNAVYLLLKWGGSDKNPHEYQLYYLTEDQDFSAPTYTDDKGHFKSNGLSHYDLWCVPGTEPPKGPGTELPDGGATALLLGGGLLLLSGVRRVGFPRN